MPKIYHSEFVLVTISHIKLHFLCEDFYAEKRGFQLVQAVFGGAPDWYPAARIVQL